MPIEKIEGGGTVITGDSIPVFRLLTLKSALRLEILGMNISRGKRSVYSIVKEELGFKGNKQKVYDQLCNYIEEQKNDQTSST